MSKTSNKFILPQVIVDLACYWNEWFKQLGLTDSNSIAKDSRLVLMQYTKAKKQNERINQMFVQVTRENHTTCSRSCAYHFFGRRGLFSSRKKKWPLHGSLEGVGSFLENTMDKENQHAPPRQQVSDPLRRGQPLLSLLKRRMPTKNTYSSRRGPAKIRPKLTLLEDDSAKGVVESTEKESRKRKYPG